MKKWLKEWLPSIVALLLVTGDLLGTGIWIGNITTRVEHVEEHVKNPTVPMPWQEKLDMFITRREAEKADSELRDTLKNIESKIDWLYRNAQSKTGTAMSTP